MALSFLRPSRTVLMIGDETLNIFAVGSRSTRHVDSIPWQLPGFEETVAGLIKKECGGKPILILNDMTDQHFKGGQRLPKVGIMDKKNVLARKLKVAFPNHPIRGALPLKDKKDKSAPKSKSSGLYLYAAVPMSEQVTKTIDAVRSSQASIAGMALLPVESAGMVKKLGEKLAGKGEEPKRWVIFLGQHIDGSLRQVITRDGQLAMTRMTPVTNAENEHERWAREVNQEIKATISYLSRFGFSPNDGTDIITICNQESGDYLENLIEIPCRYTALTAPEAATELGLSLGLQEDPRYADPLHAAWAGGKPSLSMPMGVPDLERVKKPRQIATLAILLLIAGAGYLGYQTFTGMQKISSQKQQLATQKRMLAQANEEYRGQVAKMKEAGFDVLLVMGAIRSYEKLQEHDVPALEIIKDINTALGEDLNLNAISINYIPPPKSEGRRGRGAQEEKSGRLETTIMLKFPSTIDPADGVREINLLQQRLQSIFSGFDVIIEKNVVGLEYSDTFTGATGTTVRQARAEDYAAELRIEGPLND